MNRWVTSGLLVTALAACSSSSGTGGSTGPGEHDDAGSTGALGTDAASPPGTPPGQGAGDASADATTPSAADAATPASTSKLVLQIPSTFQGTTREIDVVVESSLPAAGPPAGSLYRASAPVVTAGQPLTLTIDPSGINGDYYVLAVLYMQGGGMFVPKTGVDYEASGTQKVHFDGKPIDLGTMALELAK